MTRELCHTRYSQMNIARIAGVVARDAAVDEGIRAWWSKTVFGAGNLGAGNRPVVDRAGCVTRPRCGRQTVASLETAHSDLGAASKPALLDHRNMPVER